jgi:error-prone DNA polymerase
MIEVTCRDMPQAAERPGPVLCACFCNTCAHDWRDTVMRRRFSSADDLASRMRLRREELQTLETLAEIGALQAFGAHRRGALWQVEKAVRPSGELFEQGTTNAEPGTRNKEPGTTNHEPRTKNQEFSTSDSPLSPMTLTERIQADYAGTSLTIGPHPMALRRSDLALRGVLRASDLARAPRGRRVRVAGSVITRQRPGTAKGFVFLTLEDETGIANLIVRPDLYARERLTIIEQRFLLVEGMLQSEDGATSVRAERVQKLDGLPPIAVDSHDFF